MQRTSFSTMPCSIAQCLEVVGEWWSLLILRDVFLGVHRFDDLQHHLGISRNVLQQRLGRLVDAGVLERIPYLAHPPRFEYRLTAKGRDLWPVLTALRQWGDRYAAPDGPPVELVHQACGQVAQVHQVCGACGATLGPEDVRLRPGPGADRPPRRAAKTSRRR